MSINLSRNTEKVDVVESQFYMTAAVCHATEKCYEIIFVALNYIFIAYNNQI